MKLFDRVMDWLEVNKLKQLRARYGIEVQLVRAV